MSTLKSQYYEGLLVEGIKKQLLSRINLQCLKGKKEMKREKKLPMANSTFPQTLRCSHSHTLSIIMCLSKSRKLTIIIFTFRYT